MSKWTQALNTSNPTNYTETWRISLTSETQMILFFFFLIPGYFICVVSKSSNSFLVVLLAFKGLKQRLSSHLSQSWSPRKCSIPRAWQSAPLLFQEVKERVPAAQAVKAETSLSPQDWRELYFILLGSPEVQCEHKTGFKNLFPGKLLWLQDHTACSHSLLQ